MHNNIAYTKALLEKQTVVVNRVVLSTSSKVSKETLKYIKHLPLPLDSQIQIERTVPIFLQDCVPGVKKFLSIGLPFALHSST